MNILRFLFFVSMSYGYLTTKSYVAEPYSSICTGFISTLYGFAEQKCSNAPSYQKASCACFDPEYVKTVLNCITQFMHNVTANEREMKRNKAINGLLSVCKQYNQTSITELNKTAVNLQPYGLKNGKPGTWNATHAFAPTDEELFLAENAYHCNNKGEPLNKKYGAILVGYWGIIVVIRSLKHWTAHMFPLLSHNLNKFSLVRKYRANFELKMLKYVHISSCHLFILGTFFLLMITFTFGDLPTFYPNYYWLYSDSATYNAFLGMRSGVLVLYMLPLTILFAGRNNFLLWFTGWPMEPFLLFHKWIARTEVFLLVVHAVSYSIEKVLKTKYSDLWKMAYWNWGVVGIIMGCLIFVQSLVMFRRIAYDFFVFLHIIGVILFLVGGFYHLHLLRETPGLYFFYAAFAVWSLDRAVRFFRVISAALDFHFKAKFGDNATAELYNNTLVFTIEEPKFWKLIENPGSHVFIHFFHFSKFWQSHPFTVVPSVECPNKLKIFCRVHSGITKDIANKVLESTDYSEKSSLVPKKDLKVLLDGPYGQSHDLFEYDELVFIAGGTGISSPFAYISSILHKYPERSQKIKLFWALREPSLYDWFRSELEYLEKQMNVEVNLFISSGGSPDCRKLDIETVIKSQIRDTSGPMSILCCGPQSMNAAAKDAVAQSLETTPYFIQFYEESFNM